MKASNGWFHAFSLFITNMKKLFFSLLWMSFVGMLSAQDDKSYVPKQGDWGITIDPCSFLNFMNYSSMDNHIRGELFIYDKYSINIGLATYGLSNTVRAEDSHKENRAGYYVLELGCRYFWNSEARLRPFVGASLSIADIWANSSEITFSDDSAIDFKYKTPYYMTIGIGAEYFFCPKVSLSTDLSLILSAYYEENSRFLSYFYASCMGGLGGKLALNMYF